MHDSGDESSNASSHGYKKMKKHLTRALQKQLSKITDVDEGDAAQEERKTTPVVTVSLAQEKTENDLPTVYKPVLKTTQKVSSNTPHPSVPGSNTSTPFPPLRSSSRLSSKMASPNPAEDHHVSFSDGNKKAVSVYSDDFE
jgi:hypothetical protein